MTDPFEQLKEAAEKRVKDDEAAFAAWVAKYRWAIYLACAVAGFILAKVV